MSSPADRPDTAESAWKRRRSLLLVSVMEGAPVQGGPSASGCVRISVGGRAVGTGAGSVTVRGQSVSDRPTITEHNHTVMSEPSFAMATSHDSTERVAIFMARVCVWCASLCHHGLIHAIADNLCKHVIRQVELITILHFFPLASKGQNKHSGHTRSGKVSTRGSLKATERSAHVARR